MTVGTGVLSGVSTSLDTVSAVYVLGSPTHLELTEAQYLSGLEDTAFTWSATAGAKDLRYYCKRWWLRSSGIKQINFND